MLWENSGIFILENCGKVPFANNNVIIYITLLKWDYGEIFWKTEESTYMVDFPDLSGLLFC